MRVLVGGKVILASVVKVEGRGTLVGGKRSEREGRIKELVDGQNPGSEAFPTSKGDVRGGAMQKGECVRVIEGEEVRGDDSVEYFLLAGVRNIS